MEERRDIYCTHKYTRNSQKSVHRYKWYLSLLRNFLPEKLFPLYETEFVRCYTTYITTTDKRDWTVRCRSECKWLKKSSVLVNVLNIKTWSEGFFKKNVSKTREIMRSCTNWQDKGVPLKRRIQSHRPKPTGAENLFPMRLPQIQIFTMIHIIIMMDQ